MKSCRLSLRLAGVLAGGICRLGLGRARIVRHLYYSLGAMPQSSLAWLSPSRSSNDTLQFPGGNRWNKLLVPGALFETISVNLGDLEPGSSDYDLSAMPQYPKSTSLNIATPADARLRSRNIADGQFLILAAQERNAW